MKTLLASVLMILGTSTLAYAGSAQLELFADYNPANGSYSEKLISSTEAPLTAGYFYEYMAACYKGNPADVHALIVDMVKVFNCENPEAPAWVRTKFYTGHNGKQYLKVVMGARDGESFGRVLYTHMPKCTR